MGTSKLSSWEGKTRLVCAGGIAYPTTKNYIVESGLKAKEIEMGTTAESLELRFQLYLYLLSMHERLLSLYVSPAIMNIDVFILYDSLHTNSLLCLYH